jgi:hypothetical protein
VGSSPIISTTIISTTIISTTSANSLLSRAAGGASLG